MSVGRREYIFPWLLLIIVHHEGLYGQKLLNSCTLALSSLYKIIQLSSKSLIYIQTRSKREITSMMPCTTIALKMNANHDHVRRVLWALIADFEIIRNDGSSKRLK